MKNRYAYALVFTLASIPVAAQPAPPEPAEPRPAVAGPIGPGPVGIGPQGPGPIGPGPVGPGPLGPGPVRVGPADGPMGPGPAFLPTPLEILTNPGVIAPSPVMAPAGPMLPALAAITIAGGNGRFVMEPMAFEFAQDRGKDRETELREREREREMQMYNEGYSSALDSRYDRAIGYFDRVIELKGAKLDAALYWKAYSQNRVGQRSEALATLAELAKASPNSTYRKHASALEAEVRRDLGQPVRPQDSNDDEVKLMALSALANTAPEEAIPMLEKVLDGTSSPKVKQRALFVLAQSKSPRAREVMRNYAKGSSTPELQSQAIHYLGVQGGPESRALLAEIYGATTDVDAKRRILRAFMVAGERDRLFKAAQGEQNPELRAEAVTQLGAMNAQEELWQLYQKESSIDVKRRILRSMQAAGSVDRIIELAKVEQNPELRREVVRALGGMRASRTSDVLVQIYGTETNVEVRKSIVNALAGQDNATALVALARKEQDSVMKREIVSRLANMRNKVATDYMIELLGK